MDQFNSTTLNNRNIEPQRQCGNCKRTYNFSNVKKDYPDFIQYELGAHAAHSVGHTVEFARKGFDGVIQLYPFTCMPEVSARAILGNVSKTLSMPVLHFSLSEQTGDTGVDTRIEAFVDMLERKRKNRKNRKK